jgi:hypothetical protein
MNLRDEFQQHANECRRMAAATKEPRSKATWTELAKRWEVAAQNQAKAEEVAVQLRRNRVPHRRPKQHGWLDNALS